MLAVKLLVWMAVRASGQNRGNHPDACNPFFDKFKNLAKATTPYFGFKEKDTNIEHCLFKLAVDKHGTSGGHKLFKKAEADEECRKYESWLPQLHNVPFIKHDNNQFGAMAGTFSGHAHDQDQKGFVPLGATVKGSWNNSPQKFKVQWDKGTNVESELDKSKPPLDNDNNDGVQWRSVDETSIVVLFSYNAAWRAYKPNQFPMGNRIHLYCHYFPAEPRTTTTASTSTSTTTIPAANTDATASPINQPTNPPDTPRPAANTTVDEEEETTGANQIGSSVIGILIGIAAIVVVQMA